MQLKMTFDVPEIVLVFLERALSGERHEALLWLWDKAETIKAKHIKKYPGKYARGGYFTTYGYFKLPGIESRVRVNLRYSLERGVDEPKGNIFLNATLEERCIRIPEEDLKNLVADRILLDLQQTFQVENS